MADPDPLLAWLCLHQGVKAVEEALSATMEEHCDCTLSEHAALYRLRDQRLTMAELSEQLSISPSGVTRLVDRLVRRGWVERAQPPGNRRTVYAVLTDEGLRMLQGTTMVVYWQAVSEHFESTMDAVARRVASNDLRFGVLAKSPRARSPKPSRERVQTQR